MAALDTPKFLKSKHIPPLIAGALAGVSVDVTLYPLDTLKTRLQSAQGFQKAGGFSGVYRGLLTVATTSMPTTALFFVSYEATKALCVPLVAPHYVPMVHMFAACVGEVLACVIRVPTEIAKQRKQTYVGTNIKSSISILLHYWADKKHSLKKTCGEHAQSMRHTGGGSADNLPVLTPIEQRLVAVMGGLQFAAGDSHVAANPFPSTAYRSEGFFRGVYRGFGSTVMRDLPFSFIELPVWELLKTTIRKYNDGEITSFQSALCGSIAGGFASAVTTPLDLAKTRIMLADEYTVTRKLRIRPVLTTIYVESGFKGLFAGVMPRMTAFMIGGFVFFGVYEEAKKILEKYFDR